MKDPSQDSLSNLIAQCREQTVRYTQREDYDPAACFEIWRRAIVERDEAAWQAAHEQYGGFVKRWLVQRLASQPALQFEEEVLINGVFINFFRFVGPEKFSSFHSLPSILAYLKMVCGTIVIDAQRDNQARYLDIPLDPPAKQGDDSASLSPGERLFSPGDPEKEAADRADRASFWQGVWQKLPDPADRLLIYLRYVLDMPPREIIQHYPQYFADINGVYRRNKNILWRLRNSGL